MPSRGNSVMSDLFRVVVVTGWLGGLTLTFGQGTPTVTMTAPTTLVASSAVSTVTMTPASAVATSTSTVTSTSSVISSSVSANQPTQSTSGTGTLPTSSLQSTPTQAPSVTPTPVVPTTTQLRSSTRFASSTPTPGSSVRVVSLTPSSALPVSPSTKSSSPAGMVMTSSTAMPLQPTPPVTTAPTSEVPSTMQASSSSFTVYTMSLSTSVMSTVTSSVMSTEPTPPVTTAPTSEVIIPVAPVKSKGDDTTMLIILPSAIGGGLLLFLIIAILIYRYRHRYSKSDYAVAAQHQAHINVSTGYQLQGGVGGEMKQSTSKTHLTSDEQQAGESATPSEKTFSFSAGPPTVFSNPGYLEIMKKTADPLPEPKDFYGKTANGIELSRVGGETDGTTYDDVVFSPVPVPAPRGRKPM